jgi:hypothetical protein
MCQHGNRQMAMMDASLDDPKPVFKTIAGTYQSKRFNSRMTLHTAAMAIFLLPIRLMVSKKIWTIL